MRAQETTEKAWLSSNKSTSLMLTPALASAIGIAFAGALFLH